MLEETLNQKGKEKCPKHAGSYLIYNKKLGRKECQKCENKKEQCPKHIGYELIYFNSKLGKKECLKCIMQQNQEGLEELGEQKPRFCIKHGGFELNFFCTTCMKPICEKCILHHKKHNIESIALKSDKLKDQYASFKQEFKILRANWDHYYQFIRAKKQAIQIEVDQTAKNIDAMFETLVEKIRIKKNEIVASFRVKADSIFKEFFDPYRSYEEEKTQIEKQKERMKELKEVYRGEDNALILNKSIQYQLEDLFDSYCQSQQNKLESFKTRFNLLKSKINSRFEFQNNFDETELVDLLNRQYVIQLLKTDSYEDEDSFRDDLQLSPEEQKLTVNPYSVVSVFSF